MLKTVVFLVIDMKVPMQDDDWDEDDDGYDSEDLNDIYSKKTGALPAPKQPVIKQESNGRGAKRKLTPEPSPGPVAQKVRPCTVTLGSTAKL